MAKRKRKKTKRLIAACTAGGLVLAVLLFFEIFRVRNVEVTGNTRYTAEEIQDMALTGPLSTNTILLTTFRSVRDMSEIPFMESVEFEYIDSSTIRIEVTEKKTIGYVEFEGQNVYFDKDGIVLECISAGNQGGVLSPEPISAGDLTGSSGEVEDPGTESASSGEGGALSSDAIQSARVSVSEFHPSLENVPLVTGLVFEHAAENEQIPVEDPSVFRTILALTRMIEKYSIYPDRVEFDEKYQITLYYYDTVRISLGRDDELEEKMTRLAAILPKLEGMSGILHMENYSETSDSFVFSKD